MYRQFEESLKDEELNAAEKNVPATDNSKQENDNNEVHVGVKYWWVELLQNRLFFRRSEFWWINIVVREMWNWRLSKFILTDVF